MTDMLYEKQGAYLQAKIDDAQAMLAEGDSVEKISRITKLSEREENSPIGLIHAARDRSKIHW